MKLAPIRLVFVVQHLGGGICGVYDTLESALISFKSAYQGGIEVAEEIFEDEFDKADPFLECDVPPVIEVWDLDGGFVDMYESPDEVEKQLKEIAEAHCGSIVGEKDD